MNFYGKKIRTDKTATLQVGFVSAQKSFATLQEGFVSAQKPSSRQIVSFCI
jgi:hypothetical protein